MKERLHETLLKVKELAKPDCPSAICDLLSCVAPYPTFELYEDYCEFCSLLYAGFKAWPDFSGTIAYPVVELESETALRCFECTKDKAEVACALYLKCMPWADTPYGRKRRELLDFLIDWTKPCGKS